MVEKTRVQNKKKSVRRQLGLLLATEDLNNNKKHYEKNKVSHRKQKTLKIKFIPNL